MSKRESHKEETIGEIVDRVVEQTGTGVRPIMIEFLFCCGRAEGQKEHISPINTPWSIVHSCGKCTCCRKGECIKGPVKMVWPPGTKPAKKKAKKNKKTRK